MIKPEKIPVLLFLRAKLGFATCRPSCASGPEPFPVQERIAGHGIHSSGPATRKSEAAFSDHAAQHFAGAAINRRGGGMAVTLLHQSQTFFAT